jgi:Fe-S-cluster-containing dehydrogenase component
MSSLTRPKLPVLGQPDAPERPPADGQRRWRSLEELGAPRAPTPEFEMGAADPPGILSRRGFLQLLGASAALASLDACRPPRHKILPYVRQPEKALPPGASVHYATALSLSGYATGLLVTCQDGRPIKVEGNPDHPSSLGAVGSQELASLLDLYDPRRAKGFWKGREPLAQSALLRELGALAASLERDRGRRLRFLLAPDSSPLLHELRGRILERFPEARFHAYSSLSEDFAREGAEIAFGRPLAARHSLLAARVLLSLDSDFLMLGPEALRLAREFAARREPGPELSRLYVAEAHLSVTGASADHRFRMKPSEVLSFGRAVARRLASRHGLAALAPLGGETRLSREAAAVADDLARARGASLVVAGPRQPPAVHALAHALNAALGNVGRTVQYAPPALDERTGAAGLGELVAEARAGRVDTLVVTAANPAYAAPPELDLGAALSAIPNAVYLGYREDETAARCSWRLAAAHPFESWGDARAHDGTISIVQPLTQPLFESISTVELLGAFVGVADQGAWKVLQDSWRARSTAPGFEDRWESWLAKGVIPGTAIPPEGAPVRMEAIAAAVRGRVGEGGSAGLEASFVPDYKLLDGRFAENAWLQELSDPITKISWDNAAYVSPATARKIGVKDGSRVELRLAGRRVEGAVWTVPGHADGVVTLPLGYGRPRAGLVGTGVGFDAGRLRGPDAAWFAGGLSVSSLGGAEHDFAVTQGHFTMEGRDDALSFTAAGWTPEAVEHLRGPVPTIQAPVDYSHEQYKWGMAIDLSRCIGCSACITACQAENNIPVVGKEQVMRSREMHWLRVDRYFAGDPADPEVVSQPVMCQHCEAAPCEYVCPVNATVHSDEGLNEMVYNRCVGTRYCSNNCPYKVRRFNYLDYRGKLSPTEKMGMNPDVTVRTRGVMEKCTYCVQRIERARIETRIEGRAIRDGDVVPACAQACPAQAIVFGNLNDPKSRVSRLHRDERHYDLLHDNGTRPRTAYLVRIRNPNPEIA